MPWPEGLPRPTTTGGVAGLSAVLAAPSRTVVGFDFDGTLAPIVSRPMDARPAEGAAAALVALGPLVGGLVLITGRAVSTVLSISGFDRVPGLDKLLVLGQYGAERWERDTGIVESLAPAGLARAAEAVAALLAGPGLPAGVTVEDKGLALAVHFRGAADPRAAQARLDRELHEIARSAGLIVEPGRMVLELRGGTSDKGAALRRVVTERGAEAVLFAGDDLGDLAAFAAVRDLRAAGVPGLAVCSASTNPAERVAAVEELADLVVAGPAGVVALLEGLAGAIRTD